MLNYSIIRKKKSSRLGTVLVYQLKTIKSRSTVYFYLVYTCTAIYSVILCIIMLILRGVQK